jgi:hypothetical protein
MDSGRRNQIVGLAGLLIIGICASCGGQVIYVDDDAPPGGDGSSWANACRCLQDALAQAAEAPKPVEIRVAQGVYKPDQGTGLTPGDQTAVFRLLNAVALRGGYAGVGSPDPNARDVELHETILSGDLLGNDSEDPLTHKDNSCRVVAALATDETAIIDGFTITAAGAPWGPCGDEYANQTALAIDAGSLLIRACHFRANDAPAIFVAAGGTPVLSECTFDAGEQMVNFGDSVLSDCLFSGGALKTRAGEASLSDCTFDQSGITSSGQGSLTLIGCMFRNNKSFAMDLWDSGSAVLTDCLFERNGNGIVGGAVHSTGRYDLTLDDCRFIENRGISVHGGGGSVSLTRCSFIRNTATFTPGVGIASGELILQDCEFLGNVSQWEGSAVYATGNLLKATGCVFAGNRSLHGIMPGALYSHTTVLLLSNCTFVGNYGAPHAIQCQRNGQTSRAELTQSIVWDGPSPFTPFAPVPSPLSVAYSDVQGGYPGEGNLDADPCFVDRGHWADPNDPNTVLDPEDANAVWVGGDYHLKSQAGHWDRSTETWVRDEATSACIDAGDPNQPVGLEPAPNGGVANLGAYGGTGEASKSYFGEAVPVVPGGRTSRRAQSQ